MKTNTALTDGSHCLIIGITGSGEKWGGKSVTANWWLDKLVSGGWVDLGVYFNPKGDSFIRGNTVRSALDLASGYEAGNRLFDYRCNSITGEKEHKALIALLRELPGSKAVVHDEASDYSKENGSLHYALKRGGNEAGLKNIVVTQSPTDLPSNLRKQITTTVWVGPITREYKAWFRALGIESAFNDIQKTHGKYDWSIILPGGEIDHYKPVPGEYAK